MAESIKSCKRHGCRKKYTEDDNSDSACNHHPGKPMFHDLKKGWTCCNQKAYDWDEFEKLTTCAVSRHTDVDPNASLNNQDQFYQSSTISNAQKALDKEQSQIKVKSIDEFNREQEEKKKKLEAENEAKAIEKKIFITPSGKHKCINKGCNKEYDPNENNDQSCKYHEGQPIFHDLKKFWSCCRVDTYDWDDFMKLPTCKVGKHSPKIV